MKLRFILVLLLALLFAVPALASNPSDYITAEFTAPYFPDYTLIRSIRENGYVYILMEKPSGETVFIGGTPAEDDTWSFIESTPLPEGSSLGAENFTYSLSIPMNGHKHVVTLAPFGDGTWGVSLLEWSEIRLGKTWIRDSYNFNRAFGDHPWSDITTIDWTTLPTNIDDAIAAINTDRWGLVKADGTVLRHYASSDSRNIGKYESGTPFRLLGFQDDYVHVLIGNTEGWFHSSEVVLNYFFNTVEPVRDDVSLYGDNILLYVSPDLTAESQPIADGADAYVLGYIGSDWAHVWLFKLEIYGYVPVSDIGFPAG